MPPYSGFQRWTGCSATRRMRCQAGQPRRQVRALAEDRGGLFFRMTLAFQAPPFLGSGWRDNRPCAWTGFWGKFQTLTQCPRSVYWWDACPRTSNFAGSLSCPSCGYICYARADQAVRVLAGRRLSCSRSQATGACASPPSTRFLQTSRRPAGGHLGLQSGRRSCWMNRARLRRCPKVAVRDNGPELTSKAMRRWRAVLFGPELHPALQAHLRTLSWRALIASSRSGSLRHWLRPRRRQMRRRRLSFAVHLRAATGSPGYSTPASERSELSEMTFSALCKWTCLGGKVASTFNDGSIVRRHRSFWVESAAEVSASHSLRIKMICSSEHLLAFHAVSYFGLQ